MKKSLNQKEPLLLCFDTTEKSCTACIASGREILTERATDETYKHSEMLAPFIREMLDDLNLKPDDLNGIVINKGPGSYTGLRVGFALAKAIGYASGLPIFGVSGLEALAATAIEKNGGDLFVPMIDAKRMEVYSATYDQQLKEISSPRPVLLDDDFFEKPVFQDAGKVVAVGSGADKLSQLAGMPGHWEIIPMLSEAKQLAGPGLERYHTGQNEDIAYFEPLYLKEARITTPKQTLRS
ncbi:MAG: tRNA (adenosine(37)-N6)-threonylcarbamoyltransferase complex dimerization subunit type 1 TsaB [Saprospirales bacterium]|nr:MAG: tRNA (adenosine(37)-N6)-threonylcarbamoyltransferase complex dimerization subunit type 1 TsaB [Saprospirales bacterium]